MERVFGRWLIVGVLVCTGAVLLAAGLTGCGPAGDGEAEGRVQVIVNIPPQAFLAGRIGGEHVEVHTLVGPGQEPHTFSPTPKQMMALGRADLYFRGGMPFEQRLISKLDGSTGDLEVVNLNEGIRMRRLGEHHGRSEHTEEHAGHHEHGQMEKHPDPHVWLSPPALNI